MPNRIIKESICTSDTIDQLTEFEEIFWYRLIVNCDDFGRFDARTSILKARLFPLKLAKVSDKTIEETLNNLSTAGLITVYVVDDRPYLQVVTWADHQTIRNKRSKYPSIEEQNNTLEYNCNQVNANVPVIQSNPIQSNPNPNPIQTSEQVALGAGKGNSNKGSKESKYPPINTQIEKFTDDEEFRDILKQFLEMRTKTKKYTTDYAFVLVLKKLINLSKNENIQKEIVNQSVLNSWQDIYPLKKDYVSKFEKKEKPVPDWYKDYEKQLKGQHTTKEMTPEEKEKMTNLVKDITG